MRRTRSLNLIGLVAPLALLVVGCSNSDGADDPGNGTPDAGAPATAKDPATAPKASIDRFSDAAGHLQKRSASPALPAANKPVDFDQGPFITTGYGPHGENIRYYNFDVQP